MAELKTRIILRNDTTAGWEAVKANDTYKLLKGEIGIEFVGSGSPKMKIGDGTSTWEALPYFGGTATELFETTLQSDDASKEAAINRVVGDKVVENGDFAIVKAPIGDGTGKYEYTAFIYSEGAWKALDGNYDAENVYFSNDLTYTADIGVLTVPASGSATISAAGKNLKEVLAGILAKEENPKITQPSLSVTLNEAGAKEVGTSITPHYSTTFNAGSYSYGPATGVTATSYSISDTNSSTATTASGSLTAFTVEDGTNYKVSATVNYGDGAIPKTNIGNNYAEGQIKAGSTKPANSSTITGYRNTFYGSVTDKSGEITSTVIRGLAGKKNGSIIAGNTFKAAEAVGAMRVIIALPTPRTCTSIKDENGLNAEALSAFTKITVSVEGANGYTAKEYNVYYKDNAAANDKANNWVVTVG